MRWAGQLIGLILVTLLSTSCSAPAPVAQSQGSPAAGRTPQPSASLAGRTLAVATDAEYPPFAFRTPPENTLTGFDVELMQAIAAKAGATLSIREAPFPTLLQGLADRQYDAVAAALTITPERQRQARFSEPYATVGQIIVVRAGTSGVEDYKNLDEIGLVGVLKDSAGETIARKRSKVDDDKLRTYADIQQAWADLADGTIDALITDSVQAGQFLSTPAYRQKLTRIGKPLAAESYGIAVQQDDAQLQHAINTALAELASDGTIDRLKQKYGIE